MTDLTPTGPEDGDDELVPLGSDAVSTRRKATEARADLTRRAAELKRAEVEARAELERAKYFACTDCGVDTRALGEESYQLRYTLWDQAYPGYSSGIGVGSSRPCIGCLEVRLGRTLARPDFTRGSINTPDPTRHSARLLTRLLSNGASATKPSTNHIPERDHQTVGEED